MSMLMSKLLPWKTFFMRSPSLLPDIVGDKGLKLAEVYFELAFELVLERGS